MLFASISGFLIALILPIMRRRLGERSTLVAALLPLGLTAWFAMQSAAVMSNSPRASSMAWIGEIGLNLDFRMDGLSLVFALLIAGIGTLVILYTHGYLHGHHHQHRFVMFTLMFMSSMLGVVLADNIIVLFIFWELTSFTSYLLIGFNHEQEASRKAALQALLVTGLGGLFLLAGLLLMGFAAGTMELSGIVAARETIVQHPHYSIMLGLILIGAFTKSAQTPFHFWLPNAMEAPTPASAYLHSATMVKAGVYLLARVSPVLGGTQSWMLIVTGVGALTLITGATMAIGQIYLKRLLAYTTVAALGAMVMALGIGTEKAVEAAVVFLIAHAFYKAALFLLAGIIDHGTGEKDVTKLGGLFKAMPVSGMAAFAAAASMAGIPFAFGFVGKELLYASVLHQPVLKWLSVAASAFFVLVAYRTGVRPFIFRLKETPKHPHEAPGLMILAPVLLGLATVAGGIAPGWIVNGFAESAVSAILGAETQLHLHAWHGINAELVLSGITLATGLFIILFADRWVRIGHALKFLAELGPDREYDRLLDGLNRTARWQTRFLQSGSLRNYLLITIITLCSLFVFSFLNANFSLNLSNMTPVSFPLAVLSLTVILAAITAARSASRLGAVAAMGVVGFNIALFFIYFGAPDLAMTQLVVETLSVVLLVSAFYYLPPFTRRSTWRGRGRDLIASVMAGVAMTVLVLVATSTQISAPISNYFAETSVPLAHGRNIVNVILVDYRGLDTLGEITVLAVAGLGSLALLKLRHNNGGKS